MKKILTLFILTIVIMLAFTVCAFAEEAAINDTTSIETVYERALEWWKANEDEVTSIASLGATALFGLFYGKIKSGLNDLICKNGSLITAHASSTKATGDLILGYNSQVDEIKALKSEVAELKAVNAENAKAIESIKSEIAHIAHILTTVYTNSMLPQGVKDIVTMECAECMRLAGGAELITGDQMNEDVKTD